MISRKDSRANYCRSCHWKGQGIEHWYPGLTQKTRNTPGRNHRTVHYALRDIQEPHHTNLQRMGFDFSGTYCENNGTKGTIPVTPDEWTRVGLTSDVKAYNLLSYVYRSVLKLLNSCFRTVWTFWLPVLFNIWQRSICSFVQATIRTVEVSILIFI